MPNESIAVRISGVSKIYRLWGSPRDRLMRPLKRMFSSMLPSWVGGAEEEPQGYHEFHALRDISFDIRKGESWGFIGVNGSGKSTLLKIISGNLRPSAGTVEVDGKVAILNYGSGFNGDFTGRENIYIKGTTLGLSRKQLDERVKSIEEFAEIGEFIDQPVKTYSSGMTARLGFAIMAHVDAEIMISDEALAVGDAFFVQKAMQHIRSFLKRGTFLFVSHSIGDVVGLCQKAVWLDQGRICAIGPAKEVAEAYLSSTTLNRSRKFLEGSGTAPLQEQPPEKIPASAKEIELSQPELSALVHSRPPRVIKDPRLEYLNRSPWRNDIQMPEFIFDTANGFGVGGAKIENVAFEDDSGAVLSWVIGAEMVHLKIEVLAERELQSPIVGFQVKDRLGQTLFADNTFLITLEKPFIVKAGQRYHADFYFQMPLLPRGEYVIRIATVIGTEDANAMLHCIDNALKFQSVTSGSRHGLIGVPMQHIKIQLSDE